MSGVALEVFVHGLDRGCYEGAALFQIPQRQYFDRRMDITCRYADNPARNAALGDADGRGVSTAAVANL